jgi:hypothetical protein
MRVGVCDAYRLPQLQETQAAQLLHAESCNECMLCGYLAKLQETQAANLVLGCCTRIFA